MYQLRYAQHTHNSSGHPDEINSAMRNATKGLLHTAIQTLEQTQGYRKYSHSLYLLILFILYPFSVSGFINTWTFVPIFVLFPSLLKKFV